MRVQQLHLLGILFSCSSSPETDAERIVRYENMSYQEMIAEISKPEEVAWYLQHSISKEEDPLQASSFRVFHQRRKGDCSEAIVAAAALLEDDGYPPYVLIFRFPFDPHGPSHHGIFVYEQEGRWGSLGINTRDIRDPNYSLDALARNSLYQEYAFVRLPIEQFPDWISTSENLNADKDFFGLEPRYIRIER